MDDIPCQQLSRSSCWQTLPEQVAKTRFSTLDSLPFEREADDTLWEFPLGDTACYMKEEMSSSGLGFIVLNLLQLSIWHLYGTNTNGQVFT